MASVDLEAWQAVSTRIESFDKLLLDVRLKVLGFSTIAAGVVEVLAQTVGQQPLSGLPVAIVLLLIALAIAAVAVTDATYYYQLLISAVNVARDLEAAGKGVPCLHTTISRDVTVVPQFLYLVAYGFPSLLVLLLAVQHHWLGYAGALLCLALGVVVVKYLDAGALRFKQAMPKQVPPEKRS